MAYPTKPVYPCQAVENLLSHIHSREKGGFQIIQKLLRTSGSQPDCSASADPRPRWKAGRDNRLCQSCEEGLPPQSIVAAVCQRRTRLSACSAASPAADTEKALFRHDSPFFSFR